MQLQCAERHHACHADMLPLRPDRLLLRGTFSSFVLTITFQVLIAAAELATELVLHQMLIGMSPRIAAGRIMEGVTAIGIIVEFHQPQSILIAMFPVKIQVPRRSLSIL